MRGVGRVLVDRDGRSAICYSIRTLNLQLVRVSDGVAVVEMVRLENRIRFVC